MARTSTVASRSPRRRVTFVTGTRAEFGLMARTLSAIAAHPLLKLQIVATGMHLDRSRGYSLDDIASAGFRVDATVPWPETAGGGAGSSALAVTTGEAMAGLAKAYDKLKSDVVLVVGDRVEAFAAAAAAHVGGRCLAHVHGGDRALGLIDDALRHAITKLAHVHFPATAASAARLVKLGEDTWRVRRVGSPGIDGIVADAAPVAELTLHVGPIHRRQFALLALHPAGGTADDERVRATALLDASTQAGIERVVVVYPNNDPGSAGIAAAWDDSSGGVGEPSGGGRTFCRTLPRGVFLGLLRDAAVLVGNSSSGIIEAASFGTPVIDVGPRQSGREHGPNVIHVGYEAGSIVRAIGRVWRRGNPVRFPRRNVYGTGRTGTKIADALAELTIDDRLMRKLIAY